MILVYHFVLLSNIRYFRLTNLLYGCNHVIIFSCKPVAKLSLWQFISLFSKAPFLLREESLFVSNLISVNNLCLNSDLLSSCVQLCYLYVLFISAKPLFRRTTILIMPFYSIFQGIQCMLPVGKRKVKEDMQHFGKMRNV